MTSTFNSVLPTHWSDQLLLQYWCSFLTFIIAFPKYWWTIKYWYRHINQLMLWIFMGQNKNFSNNLCYHFLQMLDLVTYCFSKVVSRKVIYGLCYIWKQSCKVFWYTCANLTNQHFLKHQHVTYMCVCVCVCVYVYSPWNLHLSQTVRMSRNRSMILCWRHFFSLPSSFITTLEWSTKPF